jgi:hypothetical protein
METLKMTARDNEIVIEADIPEKMVADFIRTAPPAAKVEAKPASTRPVRRKRTR